MTDPTRTRHFSPTPAWLIYGLLVIEGLLWLSDRFQWPTWHKGYAVLISVAAVGVVFVVMFLWLIVALVFHLRFQFSIRSLLILTVAVAIPFNWMAVEMKAAREQAETVDMVLKLGGFIDYTWQFDANGTRTYKAQPPGPEWLRKLLGTDFFSSVIRVGFFSDEVMADMRMLHVSTQLTDAGLARIAGLTQLQGLSLNSTQITDAGLAQIAGLPQLQALYLYNAQNHGCGATTHCTAEPTPMVVSWHQSNHGCRAETPCRAEPTPSIVFHQHEHHGRRRGKAPAGTAELQDCPRSQ